MPTAVVLIIANPFEARVVGSAVEATELSTVVAEGGEGALSQLLSLAPDIVVLATGLEAADDGELLRAIASGPSHPVLVVIRERQGPALPDGANADLTMTWPIAPRQLAQTLVELAARRAAGGPASLPPPPRPPGSEEGGALPLPEPPTRNLTGDGVAALRVAFRDGTPVSRPPASRPPPSRPPMLRLDEALGQRAIDERTPLRQHVQEPGDGGIAPGAEHLGLDALPGIDRQLGLTVAAAATTLPDLDFASPLGEETETPGALPVDVAAEPARVRILRSPEIARSAPPSPPPGRGEPAPEVIDTGDLARDGLPELLARLHRAGYSGRLTLRRGDAEKSIFFDGGFPVHATSSLPHDRLGELLRREGKISREQHSRGRHLADSSSRRTVDALVEINALKRSEVFQVMRQLVEEIIYSCFAWERGGWILGPEVARRVEKVSIAHPYALVLEGIRRKFSLERLVEAVGPASTVLSASPVLARVSADAGLSAAERDAVRMLRSGPRTVAEVRSAGGLDEIGTYSLVHGLRALGAVSVGLQAAGISRTADDADGPPTGEEAAAIDRERALARYAQVLEGDYFAVLGTSRSATAHEIRRAWERTREELAPERFAPSVRAELAAQLSEIRQAVDEAWRALSDEWLREAYRRHLAP